LDKAFYVFLRFFDMTLQKNVKSHVFLDFEKKRKKRILELCLSCPLRLSGIAELMMNFQNANKLNFSQVFCCSFSHTVLCSDVLCHWSMVQFLPCDARRPVIARHCYRNFVSRPSVRPSVCLSVCLYDREHIILDYFEINYTNTCN